MRNNYRQYNLYQAGLSLVELMVGMAIGLLVALIIMQVMSVFEGQKRTTTGTADAQTNGAIALYNIAREAQFAGYPLMPSGKANIADSALECTTLTSNVAGIASSVASLSPITITEGASSAGVNASDTITIRYGSSAFGGTPTIIGGPPVALAIPVGTTASPGTNLGCAVNDISLIINGTNCALSTVTAVAGTVAPMTVTLANTTGSAVGANLACLGTWNTVTYAVNAGNLQRSISTNGAAAVTEIVGTGVVNLQAQYGVSALANSNQVTQWVNADAAPWLAPTVANRNRIKSVRVAVIVRNPKIEPSAVTTACTQAAAPAPTTGLCAWQNVAAAAPVTASSAPVVNLSFADANWARYRYRVFETIMPLRNVVWSKDTL